MRLAWILCAVQVASAAGPIELSLKRAVEVAVSPEGNTKIQLSDEALKQAQSRSAQARAALLPDLEASLTDRDQTANLAAMGIHISVPIPGFVFPTFVGPFTTMDARATVTQSVFDFSSIKRFQASKVGVSAARSDVDSTEEQVAAQVARAYLAAVRADADVETAQSDVTLAEAVLEAGGKPEGGRHGDRHRDHARESAACQRPPAAAGGAETSGPARGCNCCASWGCGSIPSWNLTDKLAYVPVDAVTMEQAKAQALKERPDLKAQQEREANARMAASATKMERLPTVAAFGDYGSIGTGFETRCPRARMASRCGCRYSMAAGGTRGVRNRRRNTAPRRCGPAT